MTSNAEPRTAARNDDLAVWDLVRVMWAAKWVLVAGVFVGGVLAAGFSILAKPKFRASALISPVSTSGEGGGIGGGALRGLGPLGGLAALAGVSLGADTSKAEALAVLQSADLTERYIRERGLMPVLFKDQWDAASGSWKSAKSGSEPTLWKAHKLFAGNIRSISNDSKTGLVTVSVTWTDARQAAEWANGLVEMTNAYLRERAIAESQRNIDYLNQEAAKTSVVELRQAMFSLLTNEVNKQMMAKGAPEYAFKVIDAAKPPEEKYSPRRKAWVIVGFVLGGITAAFWVLLRAAFGGRRTNPG